MSAKVPFIGSKLIRGVSRKFIGIGDLLTKTSPFLELNLRQSNIAQEYNMSSREYLSICFVVSAILFAMTTSLLYLPLRNSKAGSGLSVVFGTVVGVMMYVYLISYPKYIVKKRVRQIEKNILYALRNILIEIRSGVPVFDALVSISNRDFGPISDEIKIVIDRVSSGTRIIKALEELAVRNPSPFFRRALWQIVNSMKSGADLSDNLSEVVKSLSKEQLVEVDEYKSKLNPLSMMYMMVAVIMPSMGVTIMLVLSSLPGMGSIANERSLWSLLAFTGILQVIFLGVIKAQRPNLLET